MLPYRSVTILVLIAAIAFLAEGRLFDPKANVASDEKSHDESSISEGSPIPQPFDATKTKFQNLVAKSSQIAINYDPDDGGMCEAIHPDQLPDECSCREPGPYSLVIECLKTFNSTYFNDTIGMKIDLDPCNPDGAKMTMDVTEQDHGIDYTIAGIRAGESKNIPIPGLAMIVPGIGNVGLDVAVLIVGNPDMLKLKIGLNACAQLSTDHELCASSIPLISSIFPWYILSGTYSFGAICNSTTLVDVNGETDSMLSLDNSSSSSDAAYDENEVDSQIITNDQKEAPIKVACVGDSITAWGCVDNQNQTYVAQLANLLGNGYSVTNYGNSGRTMMRGGVCRTGKDTYDDCSYWNTTTFKDALASEADVITIMLGTNDAKPYNWNSLGGAKAYLRDYMDMVDALVDHTPAKTVFLVTPPPLVHPPKSPESPYPFDMMGDVINEQLPVLVPTVVRKFPSRNPWKGQLHGIDVWIALGGTKGYENETMTCDGCHPTETAHAVIAETLAAAITSKHNYRDTTTTSASAATALSKDSTNNSGAIAIQ